MRRLMRRVARPRRHRCRGGVRPAARGALPGLAGVVAGAAQGRRRAARCLALLALLPAGAASAAAGVQLMQAHVDPTDRKSLQRGARTFVNYCLGCHAAAFMRYNRLGRDLGVSEKVLRENFMFGTDRPGAAMTTALSRSEAEKYFGGAVPPDLSVSARARGADWLYTFLMTFYRDPSRPPGVNNLVFEDTAMPHVLWELQGWQEPVYREETDENGAVRTVVDHLVPAPAPENKPAPYQGEDYEDTVRDLVNFMAYLAEPAQLKRRAVGAWTITYLLALLVVMYLLKREYWRDVR